MEVLMVFQTIINHIKIIGISFLIFAQGPNFSGVDEKHNSQMMANNYESLTQVFNNCLQKTCWCINNKPKWNFIYQSIVFHYLTSNLYVKNDKENAIRAVLSNI